MESNYESPLSQNFPSGVIKPKIAKEIPFNNAILNTFSLIDFCSYENISSVLLSIPQYLKQMNGMNYNINENEIKIFCNALSSSINEANQQQRGWLKQYLKQLELINTSSCKYTLPLQTIFNTYLPLEHFIIYFITVIHHPLFKTELIIELKESKINAQIIQYVFNNFIIKLHQSNVISLTQLTLFIQYIIAYDKYNTISWNHDILPSQSVGRIKTKGIALALNLFMLSLQKQLFIESDDALVAYVKDNISLFHNELYSNVNVVHFHKKTNSFLQLIQCIRIETNNNDITINTLIIDLLIELYSFSMNQNHFAFIFKLMKTALNVINTANTNIINQYIYQMKYIIVLIHKQIQKETLCVNDNKVNIGKAFLFNNNEYSGFVVKTINIMKWSKCTIMFSFCVFDNNNIVNDTMVLMQMKGKTKEIEIMMNHKDKSVYLYLPNKRSFQIVNDIEYNKTYFIAISFQDKDVVVYANQKKVKCNSDKKLSDEYTVYIGYDKEAKYEVFYGMIGTILFYNGVIQDDTEFLKEKFIHEYALIGEYSNINMNEYYNYFLCPEKYELSKKIAKTKQLIKDLIKDDPIIISPRIALNIGNLKNKTKFYDHKNYYYVKHINNSYSDNFLEYQFKTTITPESCGTYPIRFVRTIDQFYLNEGYELILFIFEYIYNILYIRDNNDNKELFHSM